MSVQTDLPCRQAELADAVAHWAADDGSRPALTFLTYSGRQRTEQTLSYADLDRSARAWAARLSTLTDPGDRVALMLGQSLDYIEAFLGCLYAGRIAVPLYAPDARRSDERLVAVLADARPTAVITAEDAAADVDELVAGTGIRVLLAAGAEPPPCAATGPPTCSTRPAPPALLPGCRLPRGTSRWR